MKMTQLIKTAQRAVKRAALAAAVCLLAIPGVSRADTVGGWSVIGTVSWTSTSGGTGDGLRTVTSAFKVGDSALGTLNQSGGIIDTRNVQWGTIIAQGGGASGSAYNMSGNAGYLDNKGTLVGNGGSATWTLSENAYASIASYVSFGNGRLLLSGASTFSATSLSGLTGGNHISFASGSTATLTVANLDLAAYQALVASGNIRVDGAVTTWSKFQVTGTGGHTLSLAPPPTKLAITVPSTGSVGVPFSVTVQAQDDGGIARNVTSDTTITLTQASGGGALSGTLTGVISSGTSSATISGALYDTADTMTLTASATSGMTLTPITSSGITFAAAYVPPTKLAYKTVPATGTAGTAFSVTVEARDSGDDARLVSSDTTVTLSQVSGGGTLSGTLTGIILSGGTEVTISTPVYSKSDTMTLTATPTLGMTGLTPVTSGDIVFSPGVLDHFSITPTIQSPQTAGTAATGITLTAQDANNNTVPGFTGTVTYGGTAGITGTSDSFAEGVLSGVSVTPTVAGSGKTFVVTDSISGKTGSGAFDVNPAAASKLAFGVQPTSTDGGGTITPAVTVRVQDDYGNTVISDTSSVTIGSGTTAFTNSTLTVSAVAGVATFSNLKPTTEGSGITLTASAGSLTEATSSPFIVGADSVGGWTIIGTVIRRSSRTVTGQMMVGWGGTGIGILNQTGGTIDTSGASWGTIIAQGGGANGSTWNMSGNAIYLGNGTTGTNPGVLLGNEANATWTLTESSSATVTGLIFSNGGNGYANHLLLSGAATFSATSLTGLTGANQYISFATGSTATFTAGNKVLADYQALVAGGNIRIDGVVQTDFSKFAVTGNTLKLYYPPQGTLIMLF